MQGYWSDVRPNGKPLEPGTVCWVTEMEGINPIFTYGKDEQDVIRKLSLNNAHAQAALAKRTIAVPQQTGSISAVAPAVRPQMSADEVMQATQDLQFPGRAGNAAARLVADATGIDFEEMAISNFRKLAEEWENEHPEFYPHPGNRTLVGDLCGIKVGRRVALITKDIITQSFLELQERGLLFARPDELEEIPNPTPQPLPEEIPVQRPTGQTRTLFATGTRSTRLRGAQTMQPTTPKYTADEIMRMPLSKARALNHRENPGHKEYVEACEFHFGTAQARA